MNPPLKMTMTMTALAFGLGTLVASTAADAAITKRQAPARIKAAIQAQYGVPKKLIRARLLPGSGYVRPFSALVKYTLNATVPLGTPEGRIYERPFFRGTISLATGQVTIQP